MEPFFFFLLVCRLTGSFTLKKKWKKKTVDFTYSGAVFGIATSQQGCGVCIQILEHFPVFSVSAWILSVAISTVQKHECKSN